MTLSFMCGMEDLLASGSQYVWTLAELVLTRCYTDGLVPCRRFLQAWFQLGEVYQMTEGRLCQVLLLDDRKLELLVQPKLLSRELLDLVASHFNLKEKEYFGIAFTDETGQNNWLHLDRRVLEHNFCKKSGPLELKFLVRFYIENVSFLKETNTVELFFLNAKACISNGVIEAESENIFKLAAYILQEAKGDYASDETTRSDLKKLPAFPTAVLKEHPSLAYCEDRVIEHYRKLKGLTRGEAIIQYLTLVQSLPTYGVHYYEVKDKQGIPWWLGVSYRGIGQYDLQDKQKPRKLFRWKQLENLYFREKKFAVEVNDPQRRAATKRTFGQTGLVIHTWYANHSLIKGIWAMAISQHQFYLDRKQSKAKLSTTRSLGDIATDLTDTGAPRISKLANMERRDQVIMASTGSLVSADSLDSEVMEEQKKEKISELTKKMKSLQELLNEKEGELKTICLREAELTGKLPKEYPLSAGEKPPAIRRRVGTTFKLDDSFSNDEDPHLRELESKFTLQRGIIEAMKKLGGDSELCKTARRKRRKELVDAMKKLQDIENEINHYRAKCGKNPTQRASLIIADDCDLSSLCDSLGLEDDESQIAQRPRSRSVQYSNHADPTDGLTVPFNACRRASSTEQYQDSNRDVLSTHSSPSRPPSRQPRDARSMPPTPVLTRNAYSSIQLRSDDGPQHFRQRSGSLESQSQLLPAENGPTAPAFHISPPRRSNSTEVLDDGSSYTSQSSAEYYVPGNHGSRARDRYRRRKGNIYANTGSMPNLAQNNTHCHGQQPQAWSTAYYVTGYPSYNEPEPYANGSYVYENEVEGHYNVNPSYHTPAYRGHDAYSCYGNDEMDGTSHHPYATLRQQRSRPPSRNEHIPKSVQKAMVVEQLRGWYTRNTQRQASYDYERGSQYSMGYRTMPSQYGYNNRAMSYTTVATPSHAGNWHSQRQVGLSEYDMPLPTQHHHPHQQYGYSSVQYSHPSHSRSYVDVNQVDAYSQMNDSFDSEDQTLYWHEDSKPGTIV
ncbi:FERM domain-containing protein 4B isoform X2 [Chanos chanos]|uniref:FERM domain-containing protein 4B isoform X2 n=1 Tax=Chanos chanos TaxID=29144 RepID=A0A6J2VM49_CHACN|nr:FERM domain-containing protein 4B-like isoform X2 [Chanos chanos]